MVHCTFCRTANYHTFNSPSAERAHDDELRIFSSHERRQELAGAARKLVNILIGDSVSFRQGIQCVAVFLLDFLIDFVDFQFNGF